MIKIERIVNGYLLLTEDFDEETGEKMYRKQAFTFDADLMNKSVNENKDECEATENLLWAILEEIGFYNSKHNEYKLNVEVEKNE